MKFEISKVEKLKSENKIKILSQKMFKKIQSVQTDHRVSISSSSECLEWSLKMKMKNEIWNLQSRIVEVRKSKKKSKSKNVRKHSKFQNGSAGQHY